MGSRCAGALAALLLLTACTADAPARPRATAAAPGARPGAGAAAPSSPAGSSSSAVAQENTLPGDPQWQDAGSGPVVVEGFADQQSADPGDQVGLYVTSKAPSFTVTAYRLGWYGGARARKVATSPPVPGAVQPTPAAEPVTHLVQTHWTRSTTVDTTGWLPGDYVLRLDPSTSGARRFVPLTVRSPSTRGHLVLVNADTTWQAYNHWGGYSTYAGASGSRADRARVVSFDRPYDYGSGTGDLFGELPVIALAEQQGLPVAYLTDVDLHSRPGVLDGAAGVVSLIHDEYWSTQMRAAVTAARDAGTNLAFLGANAVYRKIRFLPSPLGPDRQEVNYKDDTDPIGDPAQVTTQWRSPPSGDPENSLTGTFYQCNPVKGDLVVVDPGSWLFAGLDLAAGATIPGVLGSEYDRAVVDTHTPRPLQVLTHSPVTCGGRADHQDTAYYSTPSGAGVFDAGTSNWASAIAPAAATPDQAQRIVTAVTTTLLRAFAAGPAGRAHPAVDTAMRYPG